MYIYTNTHMYIYTYIDMYAYICIHIYIHIYIYIEREREQIMAILFDGYTKRIRTAWAATLAMQVGLMPRALGIILL